MGFTVTELIVVITIFIILAAVIVPSATVWLPNYYLRSGAMDIFSNMQYAKTEAVRLNRLYGVVFDPGNDTYDLVNLGADNTFGTGDDQVVRTVNLSGYGANIVFGTGDATLDFDDPTQPIPGSAVSFTNNAVIFDSRGMCNAGSVYLQNPNKVYAVGTLMSGVLRIASWGNGAWQ